jgi:hypothetical protein
MPTVLRSGPYRVYVYVYSHESHEPAHIHVDRDQASCKFWFAPRQPGDQSWFPSRRVTRRRAIDRGSRR